MSEDELFDELRAGRFDAMASSELRERVREIAARAPERRPSRRHFSWRRATLVLAPTCLAVIGAAAMLQGLVSSDDAPVAADARRAVNYAAETKSWTTAEARDEPLTLAPIPLQTPPFGASGPEEKIALTRQKNAAPVRRSPSPSLSSATLPSGQRLVDYRVRMRLRVQNTDGLSNATVRAMRVARRLGGYVVTVKYSTPGAQNGDAVLVLRVPTLHMQTALLRLSELGTITSQAVSLVDLQKAFNKEAARIGKLGTQVGRLRTRLQDESLSFEERARIEEQLEYLKLELGAVSRQHKATKERGRLGTINIALFARKKQAAPPVVPQTPSRFDRAMDDAGAILAKELTWGLYAVIVGAPFALLLVLFLLSEKSRRRRSERRLLARA